MKKKALSGQDEYAKTDTLTVTLVLPNNQSID